MNHPNRWLRLASFIEGLSWLTLLFIAMPLKYMAGEPMAVKVVGMAHGVLFIILLMLLLQATLRRHISRPLSLGIFVASFIPFGFAFVDGKIKRTYTA